MVDVVELEDVLIKNAPVDTEIAFSERAQSLHATIDASFVSYGRAKCVSESVEPLIIHVRLHERDQE